MLLAPTVEKVDTGGFMPDKTFGGFRLPAANETAGDNKRQNKNRARFIWF